MSDPRPNPRRNAARNTNQGDCAGATLQPCPVKACPPSRWKSAAKLLALTGALGAASSASASFQTYSDAASFQAAAGITQTETFNGFTADLIPSGGAKLHLSDFVVQGMWIIDAPDNRWPTDGSTNLFIDVSYGGWADLHFATPIKAFGAWFSSVPASIGVAADSLSGYGSYQHLGTLSPTGSGLQFIGFSSDQAFNRIVFEGRGCCWGSFAIDNVVYAEVSAVPEPQQWALMAGGLAGLGALQRRRRNAQAGA